MADYSCDYSGVTPFKLPLCTCLPLPSPPSYPHPPQQKRQNYFEVSLRQKHISLLGGKQEKGAYEYIFQC